MAQANDKPETVQLNSGSGNDPRMLVSALADGALEPLEAERVIELLLEHPELRSAWVEVHMVGDCLRSEDTGAMSPSAGFMDRFKARLALEPTVLTPKRPAVRSQERWRRFGLPSAAVAAAVAMVSWVAWPQHPVPTVASIAPDTAPLAEAGAPAAPRSAKTAHPVDPAQLREYLAAHQQYSSPQLNGLGSFHTAAWSTGSSDNSNP
jgi:negative regulator of sigma E activity